MAPNVPLPYDLTLQQYKRRTKEHRLQAASLFKSSTFNRRNLEYFVYPVWALVLAMLTENSLYLHVCGQYPLWFHLYDDQGDALPNAEEAEDVEEKDIIGPAWVPNAREDEDEDEEVDIYDNFNSGRLLVEPSKYSNQPNADPAKLDLSFADSDDNSTNTDDGSDWDPTSDLSMVTQADPSTRGVLVDFAVIQLTAIKIPAKKTELRSRYGRFRIVDVFVHIVVELKRAPPRSDVGGKALAASVDVLLYQARAQATKQAAFAFITGAARKSVVAIAGAGDYWCHRELKSAVEPGKPMKFTREETQGKKPNPYWNAALDFNEAVPWSPIFILHTEASDKAMAKLKAKRIRISQLTRLGCDL